MDFAQFLPTELVLNIFSFLGCADLTRAARVNHTWQFFSEDRLLWKALFISHLNLPHSEYTLRCSSPYNSREAKKRNWKRQLEKISWWRRGRCVRASLSYHTSAVRCVHVTKDLIIGGSWDHTISLWRREDIAHAFEAQSDKIAELREKREKRDAKKRDKLAARRAQGSGNGCVAMGDLHNDPYAASFIKVKPETVATVKTPYRVLRGHQAAIKCLAYENGLIATGSGGETAIRVWNVDTGQCMAQLSGHTGHIAALELCKQRPQLLISGSDDHLIKLWDVEAAKCLLTLTGHEKKVRCVQVREADMFLVSGSYDTSLRTWDLRSGKAIRVIQNAHASPGPVICVQLNGGTCTLPSGHAFHCISGGEDKMIRIWDLDRGMQIRMMEGHERSVKSIQLDPTKLVSAGWDQRVNVWDFEKGVIRAALCGHAAGIWCLHYRGSTLVTGSADHTMSVWKFMR